TVWLDDIRVTPLEANPPGPLPALTAQPLNDLGRRYEFGGLVVDWEAAPRRYEIATSLDGNAWETARRVERTDGGRDWLWLPDSDARYVRIDADGGSLRALRLLPAEVSTSPNEFFAAIARETRRGDLPRYFYGEQSYWTVVGDEEGGPHEALLNEDGAIELGGSRVSIEPFVRHAGKLYSWADVTATQKPGPIVEWPMLTVTPRVEGDALVVDYRVPDGATLYLAIRPFQVNPPWQFLKRTGGTVKISRIEKSGNSITVDGDERSTIIASGAWTDELPQLQIAEDEFPAAVLKFSGSTTIRTTGTPRSSQPPSAPTFRIEVPAEPRLEASIRANLRYILINRDGPSIQPGSRSYERSWIRDGSLTSAALLRLGRADVVREFIEWYAAHQYPNGEIPCCVSAAGADPVPEHDSHGQFLYLIADYYRHTRDRGLVQRLWPRIARTVDAIDALRAKRRTPRYAGTEFWGLMPESISHEGYSAKPMHSYWDDLFVLRGLKDAVYLAGQLGRSDVGRYAASRDQFREELHASIRATIAKHGIDYIPGSAEQGDFDATSTTVAITPVDEHESLPQRELLRTFDRYWETALQPRDYTPYELRVVGTLVRLGQRDRAVALLRRFFADQRPAAWSQWAEVVHANPRHPAFIGDMPHTWVGSDFIRSALDMFVYEEDGKLIIGAGLDPAWLDQGVTIDGISTHYGRIGYRMKRVNGEVTVDILTRPDAEIEVAVAPAGRRRLPKE
ncbi:MAG TPA: coagulation factor 5/8 type domain-containing protein, partial [Thermoanaerobaculia bacterium]